MSLVFTAGIVLLVWALNFRAESAILRTSDEKLQSLGVRFKNIAYAFLGFTAFFLVVGLCLLYILHLPPEMWLSLAITLATLTVMFFIRAVKIENPNANFVALGKTLNLWGWIALVAGVIGLLIALITTLISAIQSK